MAYQSKTGLKVNVTKKNGQETIEFIEFDCKYQDTYIQYITQYYNPISGLYDNYDKGCVWGGYRMCRKRG